MRLRNITGSREVIATHPFVIHDPERFRGRFCSDLFGNGNELHIEIGTGKGQFITELAKLHPDINYIGIEKYSSVLLRALQKTEKQDVPPANLRFIRMDAETITDVFAENEVSRIYLNFSDPWPKDRHAKRRLTSYTFLKRYEQILTPEGIVEMKTDNTGLFDFSLEQAPAAGWQVRSQTYDLHHDPAMNAGNIMTEYEERFSAAGNRICKCVLTRMLPVFLCALLLSSFLFPTAVYAVNTVPTEEQAEAAEARKKMPVESNEIRGWPDGPLIGAEAAILMEADSGVILYEKNIHARLYPASTTKLMTGLLALENSTMDEVVTFSNDSIHNVESGSSRIGIDVGEQLTMEQCLYGLLLGSANEVAYAIAEYIGGSYDDFVQMMNDRAAALGCQDTHFANANGLPQKDHYSSAYDLALIARECFQNESLATIAGSTRYVIPPTNKQSEERKLDNHHLMLPGFKYEYEGVICGKTGYTSEARQTLVTLAQRQDMRLICVIMREEAPDQFLDTQKLFDYGFNQFQKCNVADKEQRYMLDSATFFHTNLDIIGSSRPILTINRNGYTVIPKMSSFEDASVSIEYSDGSTPEIATLNYDFDGHFVGSATIDYADNEERQFAFSNLLTDATRVIPQKVQPDHKIIFIDTTLLVFRIGLCLFAIFGLLMILFLIRKYFTSDHRRQRMKRKRFRKWNKRFF